MTPSPKRHFRRLTVVERAVLSSTALLLLSLALLVLTPVTVSTPIRTGELVVLVAAFSVLLALNILNVRRTLTPLSRFASELGEVDLAEDRRITIDPKDESPELVALADAFNEMLARLRDERRAGARAALLAQERERLRVAQALHDEAGQTLTAVALEVERAAANGSEADRAQMTAIAAQLHQTLAEIRRIARELRPEALDDLGLVNALIALCSRVSKQGGIRVERDLSSELPGLSEAVELVVYRIAQEALTNVLRHSGANRCRVRLTAAGGKLTLEVADNGTGMPASLEGGTIGIEGMRERALLVGGRLTIGAGASGGTVVSLEIPLEDGA
ncbi:MAG TPA: sensor histidine kinase [Solirubrobacterales bacterium]|nr:sensor histidine kinase [Solirubrobacterales bacterium]